MRAHDVACMQVHKQPVAFFGLSPVILFPLGQQDACWHLILFHDRVWRDGHAARSHGEGECLWDGDLGG
ncbi:hypothetical protein GXY_01841 [Novacetimonas hansenii ATCC 23769]|uniref:Uncharacterized protein n=1 Tax=Novacetimonas hansenii ATCC 23769 TaxID=714995 RepID=D5QB77_NOVHA|nr:hypothetical protein GXY_01841 [Novacetimonas hansenii ATCC 23769]